MATTDPEVSALRAIEELNLRGFLYPAEQKTLRLERFHTECPNHVECWIRQRLLVFLGTFFRLRNAREKEALELTFLTEMADIIFQTVEPEMRISIELMAGAMHVSARATYVALAIYVKQLGLERNPPLLTIRGQTITWEQETHRHLLERQAPSS
ncbi:MAG: hypothetical protein HYV42_00795 [Candidatus Magasanikbacteria bacterium]|nr:hypothetical protein [Candidatus Magasanikbacteria bacterium]